ncbi:MAG: agmatine deiminase family protein [Gemmataceae bacterium]|jgi:agmatine deiminase|nr:agmatine deiminase family protein [Gemmataceae bacterium]
MTNRRKKLSSSDTNKDLSSEKTLPRFHMPAEWEWHSGTWLAWPHNKSDWPGKFPPIPWVYAEIIKHLSRVEKVELLLPEEKTLPVVRNILDKAGADLSQVRFRIYPTDRVWLRDSGPTWVQDQEGQPHLLDWQFNAWAKYENWKLDDQIPTRIAKSKKLPKTQPRWKSKRIVLEGGSIDVNGAGLLLTTEECLLSPIQERNPGFTQEDYEAIFAQYLGIQKVLWLGEGIIGDDTHGHVDDLARFVNKNTILLVVERNPSDENYHRLQENWERLQTQTNLAGEKLEVIKLPMPEPVIFDGQRLPASYANFYIANDLVLVPTFNDPHDREALGIISEVFPTRKVVGIHSVDLVWGLGTLHCMSQQEPAFGEATTGSIR